MEIRLLAQQDFDSAAALLAQEMLHNPIHVAVFSVDLVKRKRQLQLFFQLMLPFVAQRGCIYAAYSGSELIGLLGVISPGNCNLELLAQVKMALKILSVGYAPAVSVRVLWWLFIWHKNDLKQNHMHLGPLAVVSKYRKQGVASSLLEHALVPGKSAWLETDLIDNVNFYNKFGFNVVKTVSIFGVRNWLCLKKPNLPKP